jgi:hypothetical protein
MNGGFGGQGFGGNGGGFGNGSFGSNGNGFNRSYDSQYSNEQEPGMNDWNRGNSGGYQQGTRSPQNYDNFNGPSQGYGQTGAGANGFGGGMNGYGGQQGNGYGGAGPMNGGYGGQQGNNSYGAAFQQRSARNERSYHPYSR